MKYPIQPRPWARGFKLLDWARFLRKRIDRKAHLVRLCLNHATKAPNPPLP